LPLLQVITTQRELTRTDEENRALTDLALRGLQLLSSWNVRIMELVIRLPADHSNSWWYFFR